MLLFHAVSHIIAFTYDIMPWHTTTERYMTCTCVGDIFSELSSISQRLQRATKVQLISEVYVKVKLVPIEFDVPLPSIMNRPDIICSYPDEMEAHRIRYREKTWSHVGSIPERFPLHETAQLYRFAYQEYFAVGSTTSGTVLVYGNNLDPSSPSAPVRSSLVQSILLPDKVRF